jgi:NADP-dependent 3-hydroxy acid dehydrogenase YdfG
MERMIDINIKGVLYGIAAALPHFRAQTAATSSIFPRWRARKYSARAAPSTAAPSLPCAPSRKACAMKWAAPSAPPPSPGAVATELPGGSSHAESAAGVKEFYKQAIPADAVARAVAYAIRAARWRGHQ